MECCFFAYLIICLDQSLTLQLKNIFILSKISKPPFPLKELGWRIRIQKKAGYPEIFGLDIGSG